MDERRLLWELWRRPSDAALRPYLVELWGERFADYLLQAYVAGGPYFQKCLPSK